MRAWYKSLFSVFVNGEFGGDMKRDGVACAEYKSFDDDASSERRDVADAVADDGSTVPPRIVCETTGSVASVACSDVLRVR